VRLTRELREFRLIDLNFPVGMAAERRERAEETANYTEYAKWDGRFGTRILSAPVAKPHPAACFRVVRVVRGLTQLLFQGCYFGREPNLTPSVTVPEVQGNCCWRRIVRIVANGPQIYWLPVSNSHFGRFGVPPSGGPPRRAA
jgi:hypothetical protein